MPTHHSQDSGDRSDSHTQSPMPNSNRRTWDVAFADDEPNTPPRKRPRLEDSSHESSSDVTPKAQRRLTPEAYTVAWIAALPLEMAAATAMLDEVHEHLPMHQNDTNVYNFGSIGSHNVVIACLPSGQYGITRAAVVANNMSWSFPSISIRLMVGVGGGVPSEKNDIRLGDVVVSHPTSKSSGVTQYDFGKTVQEGKFQQSGVLNKPPQELLAAVAKLRANHESQPSQIPVYLEEMMTRNPSMAAYKHQGAGQDRLYEAAYEHTGDSCDDCDLSQLVRRQARFDKYPMIHYGVVASANQVMKHGQTRDRLAKEHDIICFEMEAAGLVDSFPCLVIRGICDYSDSHKVKRWQGYAASTAAAYAKELLAIIPRQECQNLVPYIAESSSDLVRLKLQKQYQKEQRQEEIRKQREEKLRKQREEEFRKKILASLKFENINSRHSSINAAHAKTCDWLETHPDYISWLDFRNFRRHHGILWISGKPGAGKSTLMKFAHAKTAAAYDAAVLSFFFNASGERLEKTTEGMHRSLLVQLLEKLPKLQVVLGGVDPTVLPQHHSAWDLPVLRDLFARAISKLDQQRVICFIDALDECNEDEVRQMMDFFEDLGQCAAQNNTRLFVCFSSRHYPHIEIQCGVRFALEDQSGHEADMEKYVQSKLRTGATQYTDELRAEILQKASGVFMWVVLVVGLLNKEYQRGRMFAVKRRIRQIPHKLSDLFRDILTRDEENMSDLLLAIQWILFSKRPLRREEFYFALVSGLEPDSLAQWKPEEVTESAMDHYIVSSSKGLAETTKDPNPTVQFVHESIRDFFLKDNGLNSLSPELGDNPWGKSHERLKQCCFAYTRIDIFRYMGNTQVARMFPFLEYATNQVLYHANIAAGLAIAQDTFIKDFAATLSRWILLSNLFAHFAASRYTQSAPFLYIVVERSLVNLIEPVIQQFPKHKLSPNEYYKSTTFAALDLMDGFGLEALRILLSNLGEEDIDEIRPEGRTALWVAVEKGSPKAVEMLLNAGASPAALHDRGLCPIVPAIIQGNEDIVRLLIFQNWSVEEHGPTLGSISTPGTTGYGDFDHLRRRSETNISLINRYGMTALHYAVRHKRLGLAELLIDVGASVNRFGTMSQSPLHQLLCDMREEKNNRPPWIKPVTDPNNLSLLKLLLERGADVKAVDGNGRSILEMGLMVGDTDVPRMILDAGADIHAPGQEGNAAIFVAVQERNSEMLECLLKLGADVNTRDAHGNTPLMKACQHAAAECGRILIDSGASATLVNQHGENALFQSPFLALASGLTTLILAAGADPLHRNIQGNYFFEREVKQNEFPLLVVMNYVVRLDGIQKTQQEESCLISAIKKMFQDFPITDATADLLLKSAARFHNLELVRFLVDRGVDLDGVKFRGGTPLLQAIHSAESEDQIAVVLCLLDNGANVNMPDMDGETPLRLSIRLGRKTVEELLRSRMGPEACVPPRK